MSKNKTGKKEYLKGKTRQRNLSVRKTTLNKSGEDTTMSFVLVSSDNEGTRYNWADGEYFTEKLDVNGAKFEELRTFFKDHNRSVDSAIGRVLNVRVEDGQIVGDVVFGSDEASKAIETKYREGILTDVSIGYEIDGYEVQSRENENDLVTITDFNIFEVSAVGLGFDNGAKKRQKEEDMNKEKLERLRQLSEMEKRTAEEEAERAKLMAQKEKDERAKDERAKELEDKDQRIKALEDTVNENTRKEEIRSICAEFEASDTLRAKFEKEGAIEDLKTEILRERKQAEANTRVYMSENGGNRAEMLDEMSNGFALRMGVKVEDASQDAHKFAQASLLDLGRALTGYTGYDRQELAKRTLVVADFPILLTDVGNRVLKQNFNETPATYKQWVAEEDVADFRTQTDITTGIGGELPKIYDGGELEESEGLDTNAEQWNIDSYGKKFVLTRRMLINDDLRALNQMFTSFGGTAQRTINVHVYRLLQAQGEYASYKMADGSAIFVTGAHGNKQNLALDSANLGLAKALMRKQKDLSDNSLNLAPKFLMVGSDLEQTALELLNSTASLADNKNAGVVNVHYQSVTPIIEDAIDTDTWYLATDTRTLKVGYLQGTNRSPVTNIIDTSILGVEIEGVLDFGVMAEDYRGMVKGK